MKSLSQADLAQLSRDAAQRPRLRLNHNLHPELADPIQRLVNALERGTYIRPHRHGPGVWEMFVLLTGRLAVLVFDEAGTVTERVDLTPGGTLVAEIPEGAWHSLVALEPGSTVLEVKPGPYIPGDFAPWAPAEGEEGVAACLSWMETVQPGQRLG